MTETLPLVAETVMSMTMVKIYMTTLSNRDLISRNTVKCADISASHASRERLMLWAKIAFLNKTYQRQVMDSSFSSFVCVQGFTMRPRPLMGLVNFVPAVAYNLCLNLLVTLSQPGNGLVTL